LVNNKVVDLYEKILGEVSKVVIGKDEIKEALMLALIIFLWVIE